MLCGFTSGTLGLERSSGSFGRAFGHWLGGWRFAWRFGSDVAGGSCGGQFARCGDPGHGGRGGRSARPIGCGFGAGLHDFLAVRLGNRIDRRCSAAGKGRLPLTGRRRGLRALRLASLRLM